MDGMRLLDECESQSDEELFASLERLRSDENEGLALILAHLATLDARHAASNLAEASLFVYCTRRLGYSESEAYLRIRAANAAKRFPRILTMIADGEINVTAVARVSAHLTPDNYRSLLGKASRRTKEELDRLCAELAPVPEKRPVIRALSTGSNGEPADPGESLFAATNGAAQAPVPPAEAPAVPPPSSEPGGCSPRAPVGRVLFNFVASEAFRAKFKRAKEILHHKYPGGDPASVFDEALEALLDQKDPWRRIARIEARQRRREARRAAEQNGGFAQA